jgi:uncharacterized membrane protein YdjX (TVP38/TMEM64 family)
METLVNIFEFLINWLRASHPAVLLAAMALLPLAGVPASAFWVLAGVRFGPLWGSVGAFGAVFVNIGLGYWLSARWFRRVIEQWLTRRGYRIPTFADEAEWKLILLCRITPGFPLALQNYVLGCARVRFSRYLALSLPAQWAYAFGFVYFGDSLTRSDLWRVLAAVCVLAAVALLLTLVRHWTGANGLRFRAVTGGPGENPGG